MSTTVASSEWLVETMITPRLLQMRIPCARQCYHDHSFVSKRVHRIQPRGLECRPYPEDHTDDAGDAEARYDGPERRYGGYFRDEVADGKADPGCDRHPKRTSEGRKQRSLEQELGDDVAARGSHRLPDANLACPLGDRHQHDVHDSDPADQQAEARDRDRGGTDDEGHPVELLDYQVCRADIEIGRLL